MKPRALSHRMGLLGLFALLTFLIPGSPSRGEEEGAADDWALLYQQEILVAQGRSSEALSVLHDLADHHPNDPLVLHTLFQAYTALGLYPSAGEMLAAAIKAVPDSSPWSAHVKVVWLEELRREERAVTL